jgi:hypothetical protein
MRSTIAIHIPQFTIWFRLCTNISAHRHLIADGDPLSAHESVQIAEDDHVSAWSSVQLAIQPAVCLYCTHPIAIGEACCSMIRAGETTAICAHYSCTED